MPDWLKTAISIVLAAVSAYMAIKVDLTKAIQDLENVKQTSARHEAAIERLRDRAEAEAAAARAAAAAVAGRR